MAGVEEAGFCRFLPVFRYLDEFEAEMGANKGLRALYFGVMGRIHV